MKKPEGLKKQIQSLNNFFTIPPDKILIKKSGRMVAFLIYILSGEVTSNSINWKPTKQLTGIFNHTH